MNLQRVGAVFQVVGDPGHRRREFARLAHGHKAGVEPVGQRRPEDESPRLDAQHQIDLALDIVAGQRVDQLGKAGLVLEQRGDCLLYTSPGSSRSAAATLILT